jgi:ATP-dependent RNA helicase HelY
LDPAELAGAVSVVLYESRRETEDRASVPRGALAEAVDDTVKLWAELENAESALGLQLTREPDLGFVWPIYRWARGESLSKVLASAHGIEGDMPAGDFVRWARQVVDLLGQIAEASGASQEIRKNAKQAMAAIHHGVLAYSLTA